MKRITIVIFLLIMIIISGCNNRANITRINTIDLNDYYIEQINENGAYLLYGSNNQKAVVFFSTDFQINDTNVYIDDDTLYVKYYKNSEKNSNSLYKYAYLINDNTEYIKLYLNDEETSFVNVITSDEKITK